MLKKLGFKKYSKKKPYMSEAQKDITSGLVAGGVSTSTVFPLDTLTTRAQTRFQTKGKRHKGWSAVKRLIQGKPIVEPSKPIGRLGRFMNLYKGLPYKLLKTVPGTAVTLGTYGFAKRQLDKKYTSKK
jgi:hypothetical protein